MDLCPPLVWRTLRRGVRVARQFKQRAAPHVGSPTEQDLAVYWNEEMAAGLESWGEGNAWQEVQYFMSLCRGRVLDIACGTGKVMQMNGRFPQLDLYGCDISDFLIKKAVERGLPAAKLKVCDATATGYEDRQFQYAYSIGSLEHFTEQGIAAFLRECRRITANASFHHIPTAADGRDHGWITPYQSYFNNSVAWWLVKFREQFSDVQVLDSTWGDDISAGKWFVCGH